ncbi:MAG TPA: bacillithiol biosynthesis BshC [Holophagaceae bacterium]|nr:bacillithiol biosynthesis BshC [Holophagaceae bacterium]
MPSSRPVVVTGQQIGAGWTPALSVVKALAAMVEADRLGAEAVYWMADEDHDQLEVASVVGFEEGRLKRHRFRFAAPEGTATGWLPWGAAHQQEAEALWGAVPKAEGTLRDHALALGAPLWAKGLRAFSPTDPKVRDAIQPELERWRALPLELELIRQAERLETAGGALPLDPRTQASWFALDPRSGQRKRLEAGEALPKGQWLSPGAALRPLMQSLLLPVAAAVLGPAERAYWRLTEPLWDKVGLEAPRLVRRPSAFIVPRGTPISADGLAALRDGDWSAFGHLEAPLPSSRVAGDSDPRWPEALGRRFEHELARSRARLVKLDRRLQREAAVGVLGMDPERLRQRLFPLGQDQERVLPGLLWLRDAALLDRMEAALRSGDDVVLVEEA